MKIEYLGDAPCKYGARPLNIGDTIEVGAAEGESLIASGKFKNAAKAKKKKKAPEPTDPKD